MKKGEIIFVGPRTKGGMNAVLEEYAEMFPECHSVTSYRGGNGLNKIVYCIKGLIEMCTLLIVNRNIKAVHLHSACDYSFYRKCLFAKFARLFGRRVIMHVHGGKFRDFFATNPDVIRNGLNKCDSVICLSEQWKDFFEKNGVNSVSILHNPIKYPERLEMRDYTGGTFELLFLGILFEQKGVIELINAISALRNDGFANVRLHLCGIGPLESRIREYIAKNNLTDNIIMEGWISGKKKADLLSSCNCFILPSYIEGLPISILEAMAHGMPVIASDIGGIPSIVKNDVNGILIQPGDVEAIVNAIKQFILHPELVSGMGRASREKAKDYSASTVAEEMKKLYLGYGIKV